jgi:hypothetical protein
MGAARRAILEDVESDVILKNAVPPDPVLLEPGGTNYDRIVMCLAASGNPFVETADYRIARDGAFIHRCISSFGRDFYFRSKEKDPQERPYAIKYRLKAE